MTEAATCDPRALRDADRVRPAPPPAPVGPLLIGDCLGTFGGRPVLLWLWEDWARRDRG
jgi:hypothetical protein